jgi:arylsulfatase A
MRPRAKVWIGAFATALLACGSTGLGSAEGEGAYPVRGARPNVVLIFVDDVGYGDVGFNGRTTWETPNLDRLAAQGKNLRRCYAGASVCAPSRAVLLTGRSTIHNRVRANCDDLPGDEVTISEALRSFGYQTAIFGKWHRGLPRSEDKGWAHPLDQGFDEFFGFTDATHAFQKFPSWLWEGREQVAVSGYADDLFAERAARYIARPREPGRPFFLYLPLTSGHFNIQAPADEVALHLGQFDGPSRRNLLNATYAAMMTRMDKNVGTVLRAIDEAGLAHETLVIFASDHGATFELGNRGTSAFHRSNGTLRGQKRTLYEGGLRVPAVVRWPGRVPAGTVSDEPIHAVDFFPTLLALAGGDPADWRGPALGGIDVWDALSTAAPGVLPERTMFWEWRSEGYDLIAAMRGPHKLVISRGGRPQLFDVEADPSETHDLAAENPELVERLARELDAWLATERDPGEPPVWRIAAEVEAR